MKDPLIFLSAGIMFALLCFAQVTIEVLERLKPGRNLSEIRLRTRSWWIMIFILEAALFLGRSATLGLVTCLSFFALREYLSRVPTRVSDRKILFWMFLAIPIQFYLVHREWLIPFLCFIPLYGLCFIGIRLLLTGKIKGFVLALSTFQLGLLVTVYSISHIAYLVLINKSPSLEMTVGALLYFVFVTQVNDIYQFIAGKLFGKHKIMPSISPKKTTEGLLGGMLLTVITSAILAPRLMPLSPLQGGLAGVILSLFGFFGDVLLSAIKRDLEIKDFSQIIPGHGGVLDRIDSLTLSAPLYFHLIRYLAEGVPT